jgi:hypothetical protein
MYPLSAIIKRRHANGSRQTVVAYAELLTTNGRCGPMLQRLFWQWGISNDKSWPFFENDCCCDCRQRIPLGDGSSGCSGRQVHQHSGKMCDRSRGIVQSRHRTLALLRPRLQHSGQLQCLRVARRTQVGRCKYFRYLALRRAVARSRQPGTAALGAAAQVASLGRICSKRTAYVRRVSGSSSIRCSVSSYRVATLPRPVHDGFVFFRTHFLIILRQAAIPQISEPLGH